MGMLRAAGWRCCAVTCSKVCASHELLLFVHVQLMSLGVGPYSSLAGPRHCRSPSPCSGTGRMEEGGESLSGTEVLSAFVSLMQWIERSSISPANPGTGCVVPHW